MAKNFSVSYTQNIFGQSLLIASYLSDAFLLDLKQVFPSLWERVRQVQQERQDQLQKFYEHGIFVAQCAHLSWESITMAHSPTSPEERVVSFIHCWYTSPIVRKEYA